MELEVGPHGHPCMSLGELGFCPDFQKFSRKAIKRGYTGNNVVDKKNQIHVSRVMA